MKPEDLTTATRILVAPMDWGLGHATRCIPLIRYLVARGCSVHLAGEGRIEALLRAEFPNLPFLSLPGYNIEYGHSKWELLGKMALQIPKILDRIHKENEWLQQVMEEYRFDVVLSDNRYGLYHEDAYSVFMTHQLLIKAPFGSFGESVMQRLNYDFIEQFDECWVPDAMEEPNLAGVLSHPDTLPAIRTVFIGPLSRFRPPAEAVEPRHLLVVLSGPEPQRSILEERLLEQLKEYTGPIVLVRGLPGDNNEPVIADNLTILDHVDTEGMQQLMEEAVLVVSRCGYSTVMDLVTLGKKSILVPTPGQTEQEYLATHLMEQGVALCATQDEFRLGPLLQLAEAFPYNPISIDNEGLMEAVVDNMLARAKERVSEPGFGGI